MNVLIVKNVSVEGPGTIEDHLHQERIPCTIIDLQAGDPVPRLDGCTHLVVLGGPMAVYEMHRYPHLSAEANLIRSAIDAHKHVMGVCLGAQLLAHVLGARVYPGPAKEIGWYEVSLSEDGKADPLLSTLALPGRNAARVFQWHGDTFDLPHGAVRLASSDLYPNQAFRCGDRIYGLQFHIEVTPDIVRDWLADQQGIDCASVQTDSEKGFVSYRRRAGRFYERFFRE